MKTTVIMLSICCLLLVGSHSQAQEPPQDGTFVQVCTMYGSANQGEQAFNKDDVCNLPGDFPLDKSYHQQLIVPAGGGAASNISAADVPAGLHLVVSGNHYWSIVQPIKMVILDQEGPQMRQFQVHLYCGPEPFPGPGCSISVKVYAKKKQ